MSSIKGFICPCDEQQTSDSQFCICSSTFVTCTSPPTSPTIVGHIAISQLSDQYRAEVFGVEVLLEYLYQMCWTYGHVCPSDRKSNWKPSSQLWPLCLLMFPAPTGGCLITAALMDVHVWLTKAASDIHLIYYLCRGNKKKKIYQLATLLCWCELLKRCHSERLSHEIWPPDVSRRVSFLPLGIQEEHLILFGCIWRKRSWLSSQKLRFQHAETQSSVYSWANSAKRNLWCFTVAALLCQWSGQTTEGSPGTQNHRGRSHSNGCCSWPDIWLHFAPNEKVKMDF